MPMKMTPMTLWHREQGAHMSAFAGYEMPMQYTSIRDEHHAVRTTVGIFDLSHMGEVRITGPSAKTWVHELVTNDVQHLEEGGICYTTMCTLTGGIIDDLLVYSESNESMYLVINASRTAEDIDWMRQNADETIRIENLSEETALIAVQGPHAAAVLEALGLAPASQPHHFCFVDTDLQGIPVRVSRTGYTGEDGFELYTAGNQALNLWEACVALLSEHDGRLCGLGARDILRLEAGLRLYGSDMDTTNSPYDTGLAWTVKLNKEAFIGQDALRNIHDANTHSAFIGLRCSGRTIPRHGNAVLHDNVRIGTITSGGFSFSLGYPIATARIDHEHAKLPTYDIAIRDTVETAERVAIPFYRRSQSQSKEESRGK